MTDIKVSRLSDEDVIQLIIDKGKTNFFSVLYDRYSDKVYRKCLSFEKDKDVALDLSHDILIKVFLQLSKFQGRSRFSTWLYSVAYNYCVEYTRKKNRLPLTPLDDERMDFADEDTDWVLLESQEKSLKKALDKIHPEDKALLLMKYQDDISIKELMEVHKISESAVKMRLARARQKVKELMENNIY
ncbi:MAG: RNA polymerase sigma factor [Bacteroidia bacterium]|nr:RNA polymerase sigma factor [Bacteroidia bacterium]